MTEFLLYTILGGFIFAIFLLAIIGASILINALKNKDDKS
jgi:hypothetical protein